MIEKKYTPKKIGVMAIFVSLGIILQYFESRIIITPVPGGKLGLCNIVSIINIFLFGGCNAIVVSLLRSFLGTILFSSVSAMPYSLVGAFISTLGMFLLKKFFFPKVSMVGMSVFGAALHNFSQICVAGVIFSSGYIFSYMPVLLVVAVISGTATGYAAQIFGNRILKKGEIRHE